MSDSKNQKQVPSFKPSQHKIQSQEGIKSQTEPHLENQNTPLLSHQVELPLSKHFRPSVFYSSPSSKNATLLRQTKSHQIKNKLENENTRLKISIENLNSALTLKEHHHLNIQKQYEKYVERTKKYKKKVKDKDIIISRLLDKISEMKQTNHDFMDGSFSWLSNIKQKYKFFFTNKEAIQTANFKEVFNFDDIKEIMEKYENLQDKFMILNKNHQQITNENQELSLSYNELLHKTQALVQAQKKEALLEREFQSLKESNLENMQKNLQLLENLTNFQNTYGIKKVQIMDCIMQFQRKNEDESSIAKELAVLGQQFSEYIKKYEQQSQKWEKKETILKDQLTSLKKKNKQFEQRIQNAERNCQLLQMKVKLHVQGFCGQQQCCEKDIDSQLKQAHSKSIKIQNQNWGLNQKLKESIKEINKLQNEIRINEKKWSDSMQLKKQKSLEENEVFKFPQANLKKVQSQIVDESFNQLTFQKMKQQLCQYQLNNQQLQVEIVELRQAINIYKTELQQKNKQQSFLQTNQLGNKNRKDEQKLLSIEDHEQKENRSRKACSENSAYIININSPLLDIEYEMEVQELVQKFKSAKIQCQSLQIMNESYRQELSQLQNQNEELKINLQNILQNHKKDEQNQGLMSQSYQHINDQLERLSEKCMSLTKQKEEIIDSFRIKLDQKEENLVNLMEKLEKANENIKNLTNLVVHLEDELGKYRQENSYSHECQGEGSKVENLSQKNLSAELQEQQVNDLNKITQDYEQLAHQMNEENQGSFAYKFKLKSIETAINDLRMSLQEKDDQKLFSHSLKRENENYQNLMKTNKQLLMRIMSLQDQAHKKINTEEDEEWQNIEIPIQNQVLEPETQILPQYEAPISSPNLENLADLVKMIEEKNGQISFLKNKIEQQLAPRIQQKEIIQEYLAKIEKLESFINQKLPFLEKEKEQLGKKNEMLTNSLTQNSEAYKKQIMDIQNRANTTILQLKTEIQEKERQFEKLTQIKADQQKQLQKKRIEKQEQLKIIVLENQRQMSDLKQLIEIKASQENNLREELQNQIEKNKQIYKLIEENQNLNTKLMEVAEAYDKLQSFLSDLDSIAKDHHYQNLDELVTKATETKPQSQINPFLSQENKQLKNQINELKSSLEEKENEKNLLIEEHSKILKNLYQIENQLSKSGLDKKKTEEEEQKGEEQIEHSASKTIPTTLQSRIFELESGREEIISQVNHHKNEIGILLNKLEEQKIKADSHRNQITNLKNIIKCIIDEISQLTDQKQPEFLIPIIEDFPELNNLLVLLKIKFQIYWNVSNEKTNQLNSLYKDMKSLSMECIKQSEPHDQSLEQQKLQQAEIIQERYEQLLTELMQYEKMNKKLQKQIMELKSQINYAKQEIESSEDIPYNEELIQKFLEEGGSSETEKSIHPMIKFCLNRIKELEKNIEIIQLEFDHKNQKLQGLLKKQISFHSQHTQRRKEGDNSLQEDSLKKSFDKELLNDDDLEEEEKKKVKLPKYMATIQEKNYSHGSVRLLKQIEELSKWNEQMKDRIGFYKALFEESNKLLTEVSTHILKQQLIENIEKLKRKITTELEQLRQEMRKDNSIFDLEEDYIVSGNFKQNIQKMEKVQRNPLDVMQVTFEGNNKIHAEVQTEQIEGDQKIGLSMMNQKSKLKENSRIEKNLNFLQENKGLINEIVQKIKLNEELSHVEEEKIKQIMAEYLSEEELQSMAFLDNIDESVKKMYSLVEIHQNHGVLQQSSSSIIFHQSIQEIIKSIYDVPSQLSSMVYSYIVNLLGSENNDEFLSNIQSLFGQLLEFETKVNESMYKKDEVLRDHGRKMQKILESRFSDEDPMDFSAVDTEPLLGSMLKKEEDVDIIE